MVLMVCCALGSVKGWIGPVLLGLELDHRTQRQILPGRRGRIAAQTGWRIQRRWTDPHHQVALHLLLPAN